MPILLLAAPLYLWLNLCALQWVHNQAESPKSFGETLASEILIQQPLSMFNGIGLGLMWVISVVVSFDLQCSLVTIVLFSIFFLSQLVCSVFMKSILHATGDSERKIKQRVDTTLLWMQKRDIHSTDDLL